MKKPQLKRDSIFHKDYYPRGAEELFQALTESMSEIEAEELDNLIEIVYCCGFTDGYDEGRYFFEKIHF